MLIKEHSCSLHVLRDRISKLMIVVRSGNKLWFDDRCVVVYRAKQRAYRVWTSSRTQDDWELYRVARCHAQHVYV